jgi:hypothetical protein
MIFLIFPLLFLSCDNVNKTKNKKLHTLVCTENQEASLLNLKGSVYVNSKKNILLERYDEIEINKDKIHLVPCSDYLLDYVFDNYDSYLNNKNTDEKFWVSVYGRFLHSDTLTSQKEFLFNFLVLSYDFTVEEKLVDERKK